MKPEDINYMKEEILEHCSVKELMDEKYLLELVALHRAIGDILCLVKIPKSLGVQEYMRLQKDKSKHKKSKKEEVQE